MYPLEKWLIFMRANACSQVLLTSETFAVSPMLTCDSPCCCLPQKLCLKLKRENPFKEPFWHDHFKIFISRTIIVTCQVTYIHALVDTCCMSSDRAGTICMTIWLNLALRIQRIVTYGCSQDVTTTGRPNRSRRWQKRTPDTYWCRMWFFNQKSSSLSN